MILTDRSDDVLLIPPGVHLSWVMFIYVRLRVSDTVIWMTRSHLTFVALFYVIGIIYITMHTIGHVTDTEEVTQKLDCVTVMFPEGVFVCNVS